MSYEILKSIDDRINERNTKLKCIYPNFKPIVDKVESKTVSPEFWKKEQENIIKAIAEGKKWKESMKMSFEKYHQPFTI